MPFLRSAAPGSATQLKAEQRLSQANAVRVRYALAARSPPIDGGPRTHGDYVDNAYTDHDQTNRSVPRRTSTEH